MCTVIRQPSQFLVSIGSTCKVIQHNKRKMGFKSVPVPSNKLLKGNSRVDRALITRISYSHQVTHWRWYRRHWYALNCETMRFWNGTCIPDFSRIDQSARQNWRLLLGARARDNETARLVGLSLSNVRPFLLPREPRASHRWIWWSYNKIVKSVHRN